MNKDKVVVRRQRRRWSLTVATVVDDGNVRRRGGGEAMTVKMHSTGSGDVRWQHQASAFDGALIGVCMAEW